MQSIYSGLFLVGMLLLGIANFGHRSAEAPAIGAGPFVLPWRARDRYTPLGFKLHLVGLLCWLVSAILAGFLLA